MSDADDDVDPDRAARDEALRFILRRTLIWTLPLTLAGALLVGLGIPWWIAVVSMLVVLAVVVLELDI